VSTHGEATPVPRSLGLATDLDVLPAGRVIERRDGYLFVRSPSNPTHFWGNFLIFDDPPSEGDGRRWEALFDAEFAGVEEIRHRAFGWDRTDGVDGMAHEEFGARGYVVDQSITLVAMPDEIQPHPRANNEVVVRKLDPAVGEDEALWDSVFELQTANREDGHDEARYLAFSRARGRDLRVLFEAGSGAWFVALDPQSGDVVGSCGVVVTGGRGRFQAVDTAVAHRRCGICSRLVVEAAQRAVADYGAERLVIVADVGYHALGLYESLGFKRQEHSFATCSWPEAPSGSSTP
jgi:ribosomal protein S18 acetylase RimI-like enzyme